MLRIKQLREENNLTQEEFANKLNMTQQRISAYEKEKREPDLNTLQQIADFFGVSTDYLLGKSDIRNPEKEIDFDPDKLRIGLSAKDYFNITDEQKKQIEEFAKYVLKDNLKKDEDK